MTDISPTGGPPRTLYVSISGWLLALIGLYSLVISLGHAYQLLGIPELQGWTGHFIFKLLGAAFGGAMLYAGFGTIRRRPGWRRWATVFAVLFLVAGGLQMVATWRMNPLPYVVVLAVGAFILRSVWAEPKEL